MDWGNYFDNREESRESVTGREVELEKEKEERRGRIERPKQTVRNNREPITKEREVN